MDRPNTLAKVSWWQDDDDSRRVVGASGWNCRLRKVCPERTGGVSQASAPHAGMRETNVYCVRVQYKYEYKCKYELNNK